MYTLFECVTKPFLPKPLFLQKICISEMIVRTAKQLFRVHMQCCKYLSVKLEAEILLFRINNSKNESEACSLWIRE